MGSKKFSGKPNSVGRQCFGYSDSIDTLYESHLSSVTSKCSPSV